MSEEVDRLRAKKKQIYEDLKNQAEAYSKGELKYDPETGEPLIDGYLLYSGLPNRKRQADLKIGAWLSAALEDPSTCQSMKNDINEWFECTPKMEVPKREWVGISYQESMAILEYWQSNRDSSVEVNNMDLFELFELVEAKLKEKNT